MRLETGQAAIETDRAGKRATQWEVANPAGQPIECQRVSMHVGEDAENRRARIERDDATDNTHRPVAVMVAQCATEIRVLERPRQRASGIELALEIERWDESPHRTDIDASGCDRKRLEGQLVSRQVDFAFALDLCFRPSYDH